MSTPTASIGDLPRDVGDDSHAVSFLLGPVESPIHAFPHVLQSARRDALQDCPPRDCLADSCASIHGPESFAGLALSVASSAKDDMLPDGVSLRIQLPAPTPMRAVSMHPHLTEGRSQDVAP